MARKIGIGLIPLSSEKVAFNVKVESDLNEEVKAHEDKAKKYGVKFDRAQVVEDALRDAMDTNNKWFSEQDAKSPPTAPAASPATI